MTAKKKSVKRTGGKPVVRTRGRDEGAGREAKRQAWLRFSALVGFLGKHLAAQARAAATIRRKGKAYEYLTYLHPVNVRRLEAIIKKARSHQARLRRDGTGSATPKQAKAMLEGALADYDKVDLALDYRYAYQHGLNRGRLVSTLVDPVWRAAGV